MSGSDTRSGLRKRSKSRSILQRVDVGDAQAVGDQAARGRAAARPDGDALFARVADEVPDDQEVAREPHPLDHVDLVLEPRAVRPRGSAATIPRACISRSRPSRASNPSRTTCSKYPRAYTPPAPGSSAGTARCRTSRRCSARRSPPCSAWPPGHARRRRPSRPASSGRTDPRGSASGRGRSRTRRCRCTAGCRAAGSRPGGGSARRWCRRAGCRGRARAAAGRRSRGAVPRMPWSCSSRKNSPAPMMSAVGRAAALAARSNWSARSSLGNLPLETAAQPDESLAVRRQQIPCRCAACSRSPPV